MAIDFSCNMPHQGSPETPGFVTPEDAARLKAAGEIRELRRFQRDFFNDKIVMPDGREVEIWGFEDETSGRHLPSPLIRVTEGDLVQVTLKPSKAVHTIHHHGIEPDPFNDGVGHTSFEVSGSYTYQWRARERSAGTYFYHCHVNTVLHVQMGMFGPLIIDPPTPGRAFEDGPAYDIERMWAFVAIDPTWHDLNHAAGLCGEDMGLNNFRPTYFLINGAAQDRGTGTPAEPNGPPISSPDVAVTATVGQKILLRMLNATYFPVRITFGGLPVEVIASDGRPFRVPADYSGEQRTGTPVSFTRQELVVSPAERWDCLVTPQTPGRFVVAGLYSHWIRETEIVGVVRTTITVTQPAAASSQPAVSLAAPASVVRGNDFTVSATVQNPGTGPLDALTARLSWSPSSLLQLRGGSLQQSVGSLPAGGSKSLSWPMRGEDRGSGTLTATVRNPAGSTLASVSRAITVFD